MRIRGGRTSKSSVRKSSASASSASSRRKATLERDDDDDDDEEEDSDDREPPRKIKAKVVSKQKGKSVSKGRGKDKRSKMELIPWGSPAGNRKNKPKALGFREKLEDLAKHGQSAYKDVYRRAKVSGARVICNLMEVNEVKSTPQFIQVSSFSSIYFDLTLFVYTGGDRSFKWYKTSNALTAKYV